MSRDLLILALIGAVAWFAYARLEGPVRAYLGLTPPSATVRLLPEFKCDKRIYCSQMTSCEEARFFLAHCPNTHVGRDDGGIPCEQRWCK